MAEGSPLMQCERCGGRYLPSLGGEVSCLQCGHEPRSAEVREIPISKIGVAWALVVDPRDPRTARETARS